MDINKLMLDLINSVQVENPEILTSHITIVGFALIKLINNQPERSKREDLVFKQPDFEKMKREYPSLYAKYERAKEIKELLECGALNIEETQ